RRYGFRGLPERASGIVIAARDRATGDRPGPGGPRVNGGLTVDAMRTLLSPLFAALALAAVAPAALALTIEYDARPEPLPECDAFAYRGQRDEASNCYQRLRAGADLAVRAEAARALNDCRGANEALRQAVQQAPDDAGLRARWGHLFLDT